MGDLIPHPGQSREEQHRQLIALVVDSVSSAHSKRAYATGLENFFEWWDRNAPGEAFTRALLHRYRSSLEGSDLAPATINLRLAPLRKLADEAAANQILPAAVAKEVRRVRGVKQLGVRTGNWLMHEAASLLLEQPDASTLKGKRDRAILALFLGCALRRRELATLHSDHVQFREGRWVLLDLKGKGGRLRTVALPAWVKTRLDEWRSAAEITEGYLLRPLARGGRLARTSEHGGAVVNHPGPLSEAMLWEIVREYGRRIEQDQLALHDLRRTTAKLCRANGRELEQIQLLLGHASVLTTERYLGTNQDLADAPNDQLGLVPEDA